MGYTHSVTLDTEKCKGCTTCIKRCPTQAIRVRNGKAVINGSLCIDCGECIRVCPYKAKKASFDTFDEMDRNAFLIALPPPSLFGQFPTLEEPDQLVQALLDIGFDDVFEVAQAAEIATAFTLNYMKRGDIPSPLINSACPVIVRLIVMRYPSLCDHVFSLVQPMELAGRMAKQRALREHPELKPEQIRTVFISPCPAKATSSAGSRAIRRT
jgi:iron only hydrogenase large subunit-like protein